MYLQLLQLLNTTDNVIIKMHLEISDFHLILYNVIVVILNTNLNNVLR